MYDVLRGRFSYPLLLIIALFLAWRGAPLSAQNATISPEMGNLVAAYTWGVSEVGFERGLSALWQHKQLPITYFHIGRANTVERRCDGESHL